MANSNGWANSIKKCHRTSVFHNLNSRSTFGSDVVQPFLINSSKGMYTHFQPILKNKFEQQQKTCTKEANGQEVIIFRNVDFSRPDLNVLLLAY